MDPLFVNLEEVMEIHANLIQKYGGTEGIRDVSLLESALAMPHAGFGGQYLHDDLFEMAAAYLFHIVQNHPFLDGNKRVGAATALVFLEMNGIEVDIPNQRLVEAVLTAAQGQMDKAALAEFFRKYART